MLIGHEKMEQVYRIKGNAIHLDIKAVPGSSKNQCAGLVNNRLRVRIAAAPEQGKANAALCSFLARLLGCPKGEITLIKGHKSTQKTIALSPEYRLQLDQLIEKEKGK